VKYIVLYTPDGELNYNTNSNNEYGCESISVNNGIVTIETKEDTITSNLPFRIIEKKEVKSTVNKPVAKPLSFEEALDALKKGKKVRRISWCNDEYYFLQDGYVLNSCGKILCTAYTLDLLLWNTNDWEIVN
jgi:hypothetical protein